jgi:SAM-dependent methyltransferase
MSLRDRIAGFLGELWSLRPLPPRVARFYLRARRVARRSGDRFSLDSATRPGELAELLRLARGHRLVVEIGTGTGWTAIALAIADPGRRVWSYDPVVRPETDRYLALTGSNVRERIDLRAVAGESAEWSGPLVDMVFIDSSHERDETIATFGAWRRRLAPGGIAAFHDYGEPDFPGVADAIEELGLPGEQRGRCFVWRSPAGEAGGGRSDEQSR